MGVGQHPKHLDTSDDELHLTGNSNNSSQAVLSEPMAGRSGVSISPSMVLRVPRCIPVSGRLQPSGNGGGPSSGAQSAGSEYMISPLQPYFCASNA